MSSSFKIKRKMPKHLFWAITIEFSLLTLSLILLAFNNVYTLFASIVLFAYSINIVFLVGFSKSKAIPKAIKIITPIVGVILVIFYESSSLSMLFNSSSSSSGENIFRLISAVAAYCVIPTMIVTIISLGIGKLIKVKGKTLTKITTIAPGVVISIVATIGFLVYSGILQGIITFVLALIIFPLLMKIISDAKEYEYEQHDQYYFVDRHTGNKYTYAGYDHIYKDINGNCIEYIPGDNHFTIL